MEQQEITLSVEIGPISGEVKKYRVRINSTRCGGSFKFEVLDLINELWRVGVKLTVGKFEIKNNIPTLKEGEIIITPIHHFPSFQVHIETLD